MFTHGLNYLHPDYLRFWYESEQDWKAIVKRIVDVLQDWFMAMESGEAVHRYPAPDSKVGTDKADKLISVLDAYFEGELSSNPEYHGRKMGTWPDVPGSPGFSRLAPHARIALFEDLKRALEGNGNETDTEATGT